MLYDPEFTRNPDCGPVGIIILMPFGRLAATHENIRPVGPRYSRLDSRTTALSHVLVVVTDRVIRTSPSRQALDRVNEEAMKRSACGIAFLGDFWHARGSLKVMFKVLLS